MNSTLWGTAEERDGVPELVIGCAGRVPGSRAVPGAQDLRATMDKRSSPLGKEDVAADSTAVGSSNWGCLVRRLQQTNICVLILHFQLLAVAMFCW